MLARFDQASPDSVVILAKILTSYSQSGDEIPPAKETSPDQYPAGYTFNANRIESRHDGIWVSFGSESLNLPRSGGAYSADLRADLPAGEIELI